MTNLPAEYTHIHPERTVQTHEPVYKSVPYPIPVPQPYYTEPVYNHRVSQVAVPTPVAVPVAAHPIPVAHHAPLAYSHGYAGLPAAAYHAGVASPYVL